MLPSKLARLSVLGLLSVEVTRAYQYSVHLISLPPLSTSLPPSVRELWKWKDVALGDGRDFFVPRPRAIATLNSLIVGNAHGPWLSKKREDPTDETMNTPTVSSTSSNGVKECAVLSNCARLDVFLICHDLSTTSTTSSLEPDVFCNPDESPIGISTPKYIVASCLAAQLQSHRNKVSKSSNILLEGMASFFDLPGVIDEAPAPADFALSSEIAAHLTEIVGIEQVTKHACLVASGLKGRPSRPERAVTFRPFSSRDAHIMLQMKRTAEVACGSRIKVILDASLSAGKAARDPAVIPHLEPLRGFGGAGRYAQEAPAELSAIAAKAAMDLVIDPTVEKCAARLKAINASQKITKLRRTGESLVVAVGGDLKGREGQALRKILHQPTVDLRMGRAVSEDDVLSYIADEMGRMSENE